MQILRRELEEYGVGRQGRNLAVINNSNPRRQIGVTAIFLVPVVNANVCKL